MENFIMTVASAIVFWAVVIRLNGLYIRRHYPDFWRVLEVIGLAMILASCAGVIGGLFFLESDFKHSPTMFILGVALFLLGLSRGLLHETICRFQEWDGQRERRGPGTPSHGD